VQKSVLLRSTAGSVGGAPTPSGNGTPKKNIVNTSITINTSISTGGSNKITAPIKGKNMDQRDLDIMALGLNVKTVGIGESPEIPKAGLVREKLLLEAQRAVTDSIDGKKAVSIVVIGELSFFVSCNDDVDLVLGHVDAGKSTLMGRLLYELGRLDEKTRRANERGSSKAGKSSFSWAWGLDGLTEERER